MKVTQEDLNQLASARGEDRPGAAYVLTPFDTWERNPHYDGRHGPFEDQPHPEAYDFEEPHKSFKRGQLDPNEGP